MSETVILAGARTPIGKMSGGLGSFRGTELGALAIRAALERAGVAPEQVDYVFMGQVLWPERARPPLGKRLWGRAYP